MSHCIPISDSYLYLVDQNSVINAELYQNFRDSCLNEKEQSEVRYDERVSPEDFKLKIRELSKLVFEVTRNCNLNCKYCSYSGLYHFERKNSNSYMDIDTARKGFDTVFRQIENRSRKELSIGFYGGEPFLCFDLIKKIVAHVKQAASDWDLRFTLTTNGTIFTDEILSFLKTCDFSVCISLDGPKEIHDSKRNYHDGRGSFEDVWKNIQRIASFDETFFKTKVKFNAVLSKELPLIKTYDFFSGTETLKSNTTHFSFVTGYNTDYFDRCPYDVDEFLKNFNMIIDRIKGKMQKEEALMPIEESILANIINVNGLWSRNRRNGGDTCLFDAKLLIDCFGNFHACEQINHNFSYGNVEDGFDFDKMARLYEEYMKICNTFCSKCDVRHLCKRCFVTFAGDGEFTFNPETCNEKKKNLIDKLSEYINIKQWLHQQKIPNNKKDSNAVNFHQYIEVKKGSKKTAVFDFLNGNIFQIDNGVYDSFLNENRGGTREFINAAREQGITVSTPQNRWIPNVFEYKQQSFQAKMALDYDIFNLEIDDGVNVELVSSKLRDFRLPTIYYFGKDNIDSFFPHSEVVLCERNFEECCSKCNINDDFQLVDMETYIFNMNYNSCWGNKLAITGDYLVRPCIYSEIILGNLEKDSIPQVLEKASRLWKITKDDVEICRECELRYACFDCREIAYRKEKNLYAFNPNCSYNPGTGESNRKEKIK